MSVSLLLTGSDSAIGAVVLLLLSTNSLSGQISQCSPSATDELLWAWTTIVANRDFLVDDWSSVISLIRPERLRKKVTNRISGVQQRFIGHVMQGANATAFTCGDLTYPACGNSALEGEAAPWLSHVWVTQGIANMVICYDNVRRRDAYGRSGDHCSLVGVIVHEMLHLVNAPKRGDHNNAGGRHNVDPVYLFGFSSESQCRQLADEGYTTNRELQEW